jgi:hypothetical protein
MGESTTRVFSRMEGNGVEIDDILYKRESHQTSRAPLSTLLAS